jgi:hypothetical protein
MTGAELLDTVRAERPDLPDVLATGYDESLASAAPVEGLAHPHQQYYRPQAVPPIRQYQQTCHAAGPLQLKPWRVLTQAGVETTFLAINAARGDQTMVSLPHSRKSHFSVW